MARSGVDLLEPRGGARLLKVNMCKDSNASLGNDRSAKRVLGAGSRVGMAVLVAASAASPAAGAAAAFANETSWVGEVDVSLTRAGQAPEHQQKADDKQASEENLQVK